MLALLIVLLNALLLLVAFYNFYYKRRNLPRGPTPIPIFGNVLDMFRNPPVEKRFLEWRRTYGDMFTFWMGEQPVVCVAGHEKILEMFQKDAESYADRFNFIEFEKLVKGTNGPKGVILTDGSLWLEHRRFAIHVLRDFGLGKNLMQERILDEFLAMSTKLDATIQASSDNNNNDDDEAKEAEKEIDLARSFIDPAIGSIINNLLFGYRFDGDKMDEFYELKVLLGQVLKSSASIQLVLVMWKPHFFSKVPFFRDAFQRHKLAMDGLTAFFTRQIDAHRKEIDFSHLDNPSTDYVEAFLKQAAKREQSCEDHTFDDMQLKGMCFDLWVAGQETTSTTLAWGIAYLVHNPHVAEKMQAELERVVGVDRQRLVTVADRPNLAYVNAAINEIQRVANLVPMNVMRRLSRDVHVDGFHLAKGTVIVPQISAVLIDDVAFKRPDDFRPERYLDENGRLQKCDALMPFSIGKRQCLGEPLARMELFLFIANFLHRYNFLPGQVMPSMVRVHEGTCPCPRFSCRIEKRI